MKHESIRVNIVNIYILPLKQKEMEGSEITCILTTPLKEKKKKQQRILKR